MSCTLSSEMEGALNLRLTILIILTFLLSSCTKSDISAIASDDKAEILISSHGSLALITATGEDISCLEKISGMDGLSTLEDIFSVGVVKIEEDDAMTRDALKALLLKQSGEESIIIALAKYGKDLRKTLFINTMNELSAGFDGALLDGVLSSDELHEYSLGPLMPKKNASYEELKAFIRLWTEEIMR